MRQSRQGRLGGDGCAIPSCKTAKGKHDIVRGSTVPPREVFSIRQRSSCTVRLIPEKLAGELPVLGKSPTGFKIFLVLCPQLIQYG
jgi:hypothetical protein